VFPLAEARPLWRVEGLALSSILPNYIVSGPVGWLHDPGQNFRAWDWRGLSRIHRTVVHERNNCRWSRYTIPSPSGRSGSNDGLDSEPITSRYGREYRNSVPRVR